LKVKDHFLIISPLEANLQEQQILQNAGVQMPCKLLCSKKIIINACEGEECNCFYFVNINITGKNFYLWNKILK